MLEYNIPIRGNSSGNGRLETGTAIDRQREAERTALADDALDGQRAAVGFNDSPAKGQTDPARFPWVRRAIEAHAFTKMRS